jgi:hypothetical protein
VKLLVIVVILSRWRRSLRVSFLGAGERFVVGSTWASVRRKIDQPGYDASHELVQALLRTAFTLQDLFADLVEEMPEGAYPGEDNAEVLFEMFVGSARKAIVAVGEPQAEAATALVEAVREGVLDDLRKAISIAKKRGCEGRVR